MKNRWVGFFVFVMVLISVKLVFAISLKKYRINSCPQIVVTPEGQPPVTWTPTPMTTPAFISDLNSTHATLSRGSIRYVSVGGPDQITEVISFGPANLSIARSVEGNGIVQPVTALYTGSVPIVINETLNGVSKTLNYTGSIYFAVPLSAQPEGRVKFEILTPNGRVSKVSFNAIVTGSPVPLPTPTPTPSPVKY